MSTDRLAVLAHELRSPVAALDALSARAAGAPVADSVLGRIVELAIAAAVDVVRLLSDPELLSLQPERVDMRDLLDGVAGPDVSVRAEHVTLLCDPTRVRQAVRNLVANGLRHGSRVDVEARRDGEHAVIEVRDDGPGVAADVDPFALGVSGDGSTGYGLWLSRSIADAHGGELVLVPDFAHGTTFRLSLPLSAESG